MKQNRDQCDFGRKVTPVKLKQSLNFEAAAYFKPWTLHWKSRSEHPTQTLQNSKCTASMEVTPETKSRWDLGRENLRNQKRKKNIYQLWFRYAQSNKSEIEDEELQSFLFPIQKCWFENF